MRRLVSGLLMLGLIGGTSRAAEDLNWRGERGLVPVKEVRLPAINHDREGYALVEDPKGRIVVANGLVWIYDGINLVPLEFPQESWTVGLDVDAGGRVWSGNATDLGSFIEQDDGSWTFESERAMLPADLDYGEIWSVHCVGNIVMFVAPHHVLIRDDAGWRVDSLPTQRRLFAQKLGRKLFVWQRFPFYETADRVVANLWEYDENGNRQLRIDRIEDQVAYGVLKDFGAAGLDFLAGDLKWVEVRPDGNAVAPSLEPGTPPIVSFLAKAGMAVAATPSDGILWVESGRGVVRRMTDHNGELASPRVGSILQSKRGQLWAVTNRGLSQMELNPVATVWMDQAGFSAPVRAFRRVKGEMLMGTSDGLYRLFPGESGLAANWKAARKVRPGNPESVDFIGESRELGVLTGGLASNRTEVKWTASSEHFQAGRALFHLGDNDEWLVFAHRAGLVGRSRQGEHDRFGAWPVAAEIALPRLEQAWRASAETMGWVDDQGRAELVRWEPDANGGGQFRRERRLAAEGIGALRNVQVRDSQVWLFSSRGAWRSDSLDGDFSPVEVVDADVIPVALIGDVLNPQNGAWLLGSRRPDATQMDAIGWTYTLHRIGAVDSNQVRTDPSPALVLPDLGLIGTTWDEDGYAWLGGALGACRLDLTELAQRESLPDLAPPTWLRRIEGGHVLGYAAAPATDEPAIAIGGNCAFLWYFPVHQETLAISFETRLTPSESDWVPSSGMRRDFTGLRGGAYSLELRAVSLDGRRSEPTVWPFEVELRFTERPFFPWLLAVGAIGLAGVAVWWRGRRSAVAQRRLEHQVRERTAELASTNQELQQLNQRRTEFLGTMSHELRTPLAGARILASQLESGVEDPADRERVDHLRQCLDEVSSLLDGTLDLSRFELGLIPVSLRWGKPLAGLGATMEVFRSSASEKGLVWRETTESLPDWLMLDLPNFRRLAANLLSNATKYTDAGEISVVLRWWPQQPEKRADAVNVVQRGELEFAISDTGCGMDPAVTERSRSQFQRVTIEASEARNAAGLGLALCARLVDLAGGKIEIDSAPGRGTRVSVRLPTWASAVVIGAPDEPPEPPMEFSILLVEDSPAHATHAQEIWEALGAVVTWVDHVQAARDALAGASFDLVACDFNLPDGSALDLVRFVPTALRVRTRWIVVSSLRTPVVQHLCLAAGFAACHSKPLSVATALEEAAKAAAFKTGG